MDGSFHHPVYRLDGIPMLYGQTLITFIMDKSNISNSGIIGCAILYAATSFANAFIGFLNPWCWIVVFPILAAILGAPSYLWAAASWQRFAVATLFALMYFKAKKKSISLQHE